MKCRCLEFATIDGELVCFGIPAAPVPNASPRSMPSCAAGCQVFNPLLTFSKTGMQVADPQQLAFRRTSDPHGCSIPARCPAGTSDAAWHRPTFLPQGPATMAQILPQTLSVTTRDGIRLDADVYRPSGEGPWPLLLLRQGMVGVSRRRCAMPIPAGMPIRAMSWWCRTCVGAARLKGFSDAGTGSRGRRRYHRVVRKPAGHHRHGRHVRLSFQG
jgi:hypothetical protein